MSWQLKIHEPSGERRMVVIQGITTLGRDSESTIVLRDPTLVQKAAILWPTDLEKSSPFWIRIPELAPIGHLGDLAIREAHLPVGVPFKLGETFLILETMCPSHDLVPRFPLGVRPWFTCSEV